MSETDQERLAAYKRYLNKVPPKIRPLFEAYGPDEDLTKNPLTEIGKQLAAEQAKTTKV